MASLAIALAAHGGSLARAAAPPSAIPRDVLYSALHGEAEEVGGDVLMTAPGRFVGRAVRTRGRLISVDAGAASYELAVGKSRVILRLEPEAQAVVAARSSGWAGAPVTIEGLFYRETGADPATSPYALRAWLVWADAPLSPAARSSDGERVSLQDLVYGSGRYDGRVVRVRGSYRGANRHADLPERTRKGRGDWVIKDGYFAAWIAGREARGETWSVAPRSAADAAPVLEIVGVPTTSGGVVRIQASDVELSPDFVGGALAQPRDAGLQSVSPRVSFAWPIPGEPLRGRGHVILQFSKPLDPQSLAGRVRVRYPGATTPAMTYEYRQRYRALVVTPEPPPPPDADLVVELLDGIIDVDGRALTPRAMAGERGETVVDAGVVDAVRFRNRR